MAPKEPQIYKVHYATSEYENGIVANVSEIFPHPLFKYYKEPEYDISILHLSEPFKPSVNASIIPMASVTPAIGSLVNITGWGRYTEETYFSPKLQIASNLKIVKQTECQTYWPDIHITKRILCAHNEQEGICGGDSGGPLVQDGKLVGVASFSLQKCTNLTKPNGFADVASVRDFIDKHIL